MPLPYADCCGCCGRELKRDVGGWCPDCAKHLLPANVPPWDRTYFAQFGKPCPFDGSSREMSS